MPCRPNLLRTLTYHRIGRPETPSDLAPQTLSATPEAFRHQMQCLAERYCVLSLEEVLRYRRHGKPLPKRSVLITFDDATTDFVDCAFPALEHFGLPATIFVPTGYPDHPQRRFWWDRLHHALKVASCGAVIEPTQEALNDDPGDRIRLYRKLCDEVSAMPWDLGQQRVDEICERLNAPVSESNVMSWDQLRALVGSSLITLAPHTRSHPLLHRVSISVAREEILGSYDDLEREIGPTPRVLAYPGGGYNDDVLDLLRSENFEMAFTTRRGMNRLDRSDTLRMHRINVGVRCPLSLWRGQLVDAARVAFEVLG
jgi:peptidoglycan/xylan/chitin deacetylase (PgdA/CDA1 family)